MSASCIGACPFRKTGIHFSGTCARATSVDRERTMSEQGTEPQVPTTDTPVQNSKSVRRRTPCAICGKEARDARAFGLVRPAIAQTMLVDHPELTADSTICGKHAAPYRSQYVTELLARERGELSDLE